MTESMSYITKKPCGCLSMAIVDNPDHKHDVAREIGEAILQGETVERVTSESVRTMDFGLALRTWSNSAFDPTA